MPKKGALAWEPPRGMAGLIKSGMLQADDPWTRLYAISTIRDKYLPRTDPRHNIYGPMEHGAYTQAAVQDNPLMALPLALGIPAYTGAKQMGLMNSRSSPSWDEMQQGYQGIARGLFGLPYSFFQPQAQNVFMEAMP